MESERQAITFELEDLHNGLVDETLLVELIHEVSLLKWEGGVVSCAVLCINQSVLSLLSSHFRQPTEITLWDFPAIVPRKTLGKSK